MFGRLDELKVLKQLIANEAFGAMGAQGLAERARRELQATGEKIRKRSEDARAELTPQEEEIAQLAPGRADEPGDRWQVRTWRRSIQGSVEGGSLDKDDLSGISGGSLRKADLTSWPASSLQPDGCGSHPDRSG